MHVLRVVIVWYALFLQIGLVQLAFSNFVRKVALGHRHITRGAAEEYLFAVGIFE